MTTLTVSTVTGWRPGGLLAAADRLAAAASSVDDDAHAVRRHLADAVDDAGGVWATTAASRADLEARRGEALGDALTTAASELRSGAGEVTAARAALLATVERVRAAGFEVTDDGGVVAPPAPQPPDDVPPAERLGWGVAPEQLEQARRTEAERSAHGAAVGAALAAVVEADEALAATVRRLDAPRTLPSLLAAHGARADLLGGDHVAALGTAGGALVVARSVNDAVSLARSSRRLHDYAALARQQAPPDELEKARRVFAHGTARNPLLKLAGRASLPITAVSGVHDAVTGGGYDGARGWATRGFGAAGAAGAVLVATTAPGLVVVGGAAVLAYGAWTAGNYLVDHWDQVEDAASEAGDWVVDQVADEAAAAADAVGWAGDRLAAAGSGALDALGEVF
ncbi:hypothetical protein [Nocardioides sp. GXQ0305]|uniref:hypothetical protein n=1 Tax=Nocardioides sp. GXQ0305 TaxID=3423912 RepID=UPI003D7EFB82